VFSVKTLLKEIFLTGTPEKYSGVYIFRRCYEDINKISQLFSVHLFNKPGQERSLSQARSLPCGMLTKLTTWWHLISRLWALGSSMLALFLDGRYGAPSSRKWLRWADEKTMISNSHLVCSRDTHTQIRSVYGQSYTGKNPIYVKKWSISYIV